ncbi:MAG: hypothetical protein ACMUIP_09275 [bacterium]
MKKIVCIIPLLGVIMLMITTGVWASNGNVKWSQPPDMVYGVNIQSTENPVHRVADDWQCKDPRPVTDVHFWGSYIGWEQYEPDPPTSPHPVIISFMIRIYYDSPQGEQNYSHPEEPPLYEVKVETFEENYVASIEHPDQTFEHKFYYSLDLPEPFEQAEGTIYWISIAAIMENASDYPWGWETSNTNWNDNACYWDENPTIWKMLDPQLPPLPPWYSEHYNTVDMAFELTVYEPPPPLEPIKWQHRPDMENGINFHSVPFPVQWPDGAVEERTVADDWLCLDGSPVSDLHFWGSYLGWMVNEPEIPEDMPTPGVGAFRIQIYSDYPASSALNYSHPDKLLYEVWVDEDNFTETFVTSIPLLNGYEHKYRYDLDLPRIFWQKRDRIYWLNISARPKPHQTEFKWEQEPDMERGVNLQSLEMKEPWVADDWECRDPRPVTDVHFWGSYIDWERDNENPPSPPPEEIDVDAFVIRFYADVPAEPGANSYSHPGEELYMMQIREFKEDLYASIPLPDGSGFEHKFYYSLDLPVPFEQEPGTIYWIAITAVYDDAGTIPPYPWGWETANPADHWNDNACHFWLHNNYWSEIQPDGWPMPSWYSMSIDFEDLPLGHQYYVGDSLTSAGIPMEVGPFEWSNGIWTYDGYIQVVDDECPVGSGNKLWFNNANLKIDFSAAGVALPRTLALTFYDGGGNNNIEINGVFKNFENFCDIDGSIIDGVEVSVISCPTNQGILRLTAQSASAISFFAIGGQELCIDDIKYPGTVDMAFKLSVAWPDIFYWGWESSMDQWNDIAVTGWYKDPDNWWWDILTQPEVSKPVNMSFELTTCEGPIKWLQFPDMADGFNIVSLPHPVVADDFLCTNGKPITEVHFWGSYLNSDSSVHWKEDTEGPPHSILPPTPGVNAFKLSFHEDIRAGVDPSMPWSHPGALLTEYVFDFETVNERYWDSVPHIDPTTGRTWWEHKFYYIIRLPLDDPFIQEEGRVYWLDIGASPNNDEWLWGWETSKDHWNDNAVREKDEGSGIITFDDLPLWNMYYVGDTFASNGIPVHVRQFEYYDSIAADCSGEWTASGFAGVENTGKSGGSGYEICTNNVNLEFDFNAAGIPPLTELSIKFSDDGGEENIEINGDHRCIEDFGKIDGIEIGGVKVTVISSTIPPTQGIIRLTLSTNLIQTFSIGGQETCFDDVEYLYNGTAWEDLGSIYEPPLDMAFLLITEDDIEYCEGDFNRDGRVDDSDLAVFAADFGRTDCALNGQCEGDFDYDGDVDGSDLAVFAADFGRDDCPCPILFPNVD